jgi:hypothetical protein
LGLKLYGTHQRLVYAEVVKVLGHNMNTIKKKTETLFDDCKKVGLGVNVEKTKYVLLSRRQTAGQNHNIKIANRSSENIEQFKYFGMAVTNQYLIH